MSCLVLSCLALSTRLVSSRLVSSRLFAPLLFSSLLFFFSFSSLFLLFFFSFSSLLLLLSSLLFSSRLFLSYDLPLLGEDAHIYMCVFISVYRRPEPITLTLKLCDPNPNTKAPRSTHIAMKRCSLRFGFVFFLSFVSMDAIHVMP